MITKDGKAAIFTVRPDGSDLTQLDPDSIESYAMIWSPDGQKLAYLSNSAEEAPMLTIREYESESKWKVNFPGVATYSWSPDSQRLAFTIDIQGTEPITTAQPETSTEDYYIYLIDLSDLRATPLYKMPGNKRIIDLDWSPRGDEILSMFQASRPPQNFLRLFFLSGEYVMLNTEKVFPYEAKWSPTGRWIAFSGVDLIDHEQGMWMISTDGTQLQTIIKGQDVFELDWSPDGKRLAYSSGCCMNPSSVFVIDLDTEKVQPITPPEEYAYAPSWSPDGAYLAYLTATDDVSSKGYALNIYSFSAGSNTQIIREKVSGGADWRP